MNSDREELKKATSGELNFDETEPYELEYEIQQPNPEEIESGIQDGILESNIDENVNESKKEINKEKIEESKEINIEKLLQDIQNSIKLNKTLVQNNLNTNSNSKSKKNTTNTDATASNTDTTASPTISESLAKTLVTLTTINGIKDQVCLLPLDFCMRNYFNNCVLPLVSTLDFISRTSFNLSASVGVLTNSPIVPVKRSQVKDTIELIYCINAQCEDVYRIACKRIEILLEYARCNKI
ncbi:hypothetical protein SAMN02745163_00545 [Clostridium cavendishii DSM 21758]|uniref:Uncharacterized protein n=1 Tax=Clostridium cavendishii DSM 21758 TaxID=1121302 RepID=A0A1M6CT63_9CLOT|nr:hypothetical protein [Clostridium cavendishii]SHI64176.1 hypothetical protein SAMN02745163_00545 [Clostridium cavendishii DSM 21758]